MCGSRATGCKPVNPAMDEDAELLRDYATNRSDRAFARMVERHIDLVYSAALRRVGGDPHRAAEVTQMVFIDLARKAACLARHPALTGWLHQSTRWAANNLRRAEQRRANHENAAAAEWAAHGDEQPIDWEALRPLLDEALDELREADREAVLLRFFNNCTFAEVGRRLGTGENAARMRVERALDKLHGILRRKGLVGGVTALGAAMTKNAVAAAPAGLAATVTPAATAAGAAIAAGATGATILMSKVAVALVGAGVVTLAVLCLQQRQSLAAARDVLAHARQRHTVQEKDVSRIASQVQRMEADLAALPASAELPAPNPFEVERKRLDLIVRKGELDAPYGALFRRLTLPPEQLDAFKTLLVERAQAIYDANQLAKEEGVQFASWAEKQALEREAAKSTDLRIAGLIGTEKAQDFADFLRPWGAVATRNGAALANDDAAWERAKKLGDLWALTGREAEEQAYAQNTVLILPPAFVAGAKAIMTEAQYGELLVEQQSAHARARMIEIERAAAYAGKLKLGKNSARDYGVPAAPSPPSEIRLP